MFATHASRPILVERADRRAPRRAYAQPVLLNGRPAEGRDISSSGLSILLKSNVDLGDTVRITLSGVAGSLDEVAVTARVCRIEPRSEGNVVGVEFVE